jgi:hypothetical protein
MRNKPIGEIPKLFLTLLNQLYEIEYKLEGLEDYKNIRRNIERMKDVLRTEISPVEPDTGLYYEDPMGKSYNETRNDLDANISGESTENLVVVDVIKPIIRYGNSRKGFSLVVQKGVVVVASKSNQEEMEK